MAIRDKLAMRLRMERARVDMTQSDVASSAGITPAMLCDYENGVRTPTLQTLAALADFYQVSLDYLTGRND